MKKKENDALATNKKASYDYFIKETFEAGIALTGTENVHISEYKQGNIYNHDPLRSRRLLLHKKEINHLQIIQAQQGMTIIPLKVYLKHGYAKVLIGVGQGKKQYDKRETIKRRDQDRELKSKYKIR